MESYLEFEGVRVIWTGNKIRVDSSSATELSVIRAVLLQPQTVSLTRAIGLTGHTTWTHKHNTGGLHTHLRVLLVNTTHLFTMSGCALWADTYWRSSGHCKDSPRSCLSVWSFSQLEGCFLSLHLALCLCHRPEGKQKTTRPTVLKGSNVT